MKLPLFGLKSFFTNLTLEAGLQIAWWIIFSLFIALLFLDGLIFYQYGLGQIAAVENTSTKSVFANTVDTLRLAASKIEARQPQFQSTVPDFGITNPFKPR